MQVTYGLRRTALMYSNEVAIMEGDVRLTWREFETRVACAARVLQGLGVEAGDAVAILMLNNRQYAELNYAIPWAGGVCVPINTRLAAPEIIFQLNDCKATTLIVDDTFVPMLKELSGTLESVTQIMYVGAGDAPDDLHDYERLCAAATPVADAERGGDDLMSIFYTGGTTGRSKGVMLSHNNVMANSLNSVIDLRYDRDDIYLHVAPMFHLADAGTTFAITLSGASHAFIPGFEPEATLKAIERYKVTRVILVPTMINIVINHPGIGDFDLSSLRTVVYGASPIPGAVLRKALDTLSCEFVQGYGMTELSQLTTILPYEDHLHPEGSPEAERIKSCGRAVTTCEVRIRDEEGNEVERGTVGELTVRGPTVMLGYLNMPEATADAIRDGWMQTGDLGYMDDDGYIYLVDRAKDMIISGGENIYSVEVEAALYTHPAVLEAAVIGIPNEQWGEAVHAVVVLKPDQEASEAELIAHCKTQIGAFKTPKTISFNTEALPKSGAGKILKRDLREVFWDGEERQIH